MAQYSNPDLPDEVNNSDTSPLRHFLVLAGSALAVGVAATAVVALGAGAFARYLPFEAEVRLVAPYAARFPPRRHTVENYLQDVADRLVESGGMALDEGMSIRVHYIGEPDVNAFATLGGHVAVYGGLLEIVPDEQVLAMVLAHEIAHVQHRHPIVGLGRAVAFGAVLSLVSAGASSSVTDSVMGRSGMLTLLSFNRDQELEADETGVAALARTYGHAGGAADTFKVLDEAASAPGRAEPPRFLSTHPVTSDRVEHLNAIIARGGWATEGTRTPIPEAVMGAVTKDIQQ